jgi:FkbM family methyltransferase
MSIDRLGKLAEIRRYWIVRMVLFPGVVVRRSILRRKWLWQREIVGTLGELLRDDPVIRVREFDGFFSIDARSDLFFRMLQYKSYEPDLAYCCLKYLDRNRDAIDVGANIGFFTVMFAKNLRRVLSIEPTRGAIERLLRNIDLNSVNEKVDVFEGAASNQTGTIEVNTIEGKEEYSSLGKMKHPSISGASYSVERAPSTTIDELVAQGSYDPGFIKIDVEGVEHLVLEGAQHVLAKKRPVILSEISGFLLEENGSSAKEVISLIKRHDYDVYDPVNPTAKPGTKDFGNILCFPKEMGMSRDSLLVK